MFIDKKWNTERQYNKQNVNKVSFLQVVRDYEQVRTNLTIK